MKYQQRVNALCYLLEADELPTDMSIKELHDECDANIYLAMAWFGVINDDELPTDISVLLSEENLKGMNDLAEAWDQALPLNELNAHWAQIKNFPHDASGVDSPADHVWFRKDGVYYPHM